MIHPPAQRNERTSGGTWHRPGTACTCYKRACLPPPKRFDLRSAHDRASIAAPACTPKLQALMVHLCPGTHPPAFQALAAGSLPLG